MNNTLSVPSIYREKLERLRMFDDDFLRIIMQDERCAKVILDAILDDVSIVKMESQKDIHYPSKRSLVYDIFIITEKEYLDLEVEKHRWKASPMRIRYHASLLDVDISRPNMDFKDMYDIKVIFICEFDPLNEGLPIYHIKDTVIETGKPYDDRREIILVNGNAVEDSQLGEIIHDLKQTKAEDMYNPVLKQAMKYYKETEGGIKIMCEIWEEIKNVGFQQGIQEGIQEGIQQGIQEGIQEGQILSNINAIKNIMNSFNLNIIEAMKALNIPEDEYDKYKELVLIQK